jgi:hypothetical protein
VDARVKPGQGELGKFAPLDAVIHKSLSKGQEFFGSFLQKRTA